jgi:hypothetical protein
MKIEKCYLTQIGKTLQYNQFQNSAKCDIIYWDKIAEFPLVNKIFEMNAKKIEVQLMMIEVQLKTKYSIIDDWFHHFSIHQIDELVIAGDSSMSSMIYEYRKIYQLFEQKIIICFKKIKKIKKIKRIKRIKKIKKIKNLMFDRLKLYHIPNIKVDLKTFTNKNIKQEY